MKKKKRLIFCKNLSCIVFLLLFFCHSPIFAAVGVSLGSGYGSADIVPIRVGVIKDTGYCWWPESPWPLRWHVELSFCTMHTHKQFLGSPSHRHLNAMALAAVARFESKRRFKVGWPYIELGLGLSRLTRKEIGGRKLGSQCLFEDRVGLGVRFGEEKQYDIAYKFIHYSNANITNLNNGINLYFLVLGYWFK